MPKKIILISLFFILVYCRLVGLNWGLPYPMNPDERNMAVAVQGLNCKISNFEFRISNFTECMNPHFFAYGQFPLYLAYIIVKLGQFILGRPGEVSFVSATMALRIISTVASIINVLVLVKITELLIGKISSTQKFSIRVISILTFTFVPYAIQLSHFGTTESLMMLFYSMLIYLCLNVLVKYLTNTQIFLLSLFSGLAIATKISSIIFISVSLLTFSHDLISGINKKKFFRFLKLTTNYLLLTTIFAVIFSPHNLINWREFLGSMSYETSVGTGALKVFYTRQFEHTIPILFQLMKIFPYALGWPMFILSLLGFFGLSWKDKKINLLRFAFLIYFLPTAFLYAKWTRFMAPVLPILVLFAVLTVIRIFESTKKRFVFLLLTFVLIIPGIAYLSIYQHPDVRFQASEWIYKNIPAGSKILSETANVVDLPIISNQQQFNHLAIKPYNYISFDFYNLDTNPMLQQQLKFNLQNADYIFVPSRRLFANYSCTFPKLFSDWGIGGGFVFIIPGYSVDRCSDLVSTPVLNKYYEELFYNNKTFKPVAEFTSYPKIELYGKKLIEFPDEPAEETWTVFDHPVVRIYKK